jgi:hypothetical protein
MPSWDELFDYGEKFAVERSITREGILQAIGRGGSRKPTPFRG